MTSDVPRSSSSYPFVLISLVTLNFGLVFFDRNALSYLMPFIQPQLGLSNTDIGALNSGFACSWAVAGLGVGWLSDWLGRRKILLVASAIVFSAASLLSGLATTFLLLFGARLLMGIAEGGVMPLSQALVAAEVPPERRGLAMGAAQNFGANLLGTFLAPIVLVAFAQAYGWRAAFFLAALPGFLVAFLMARYIREHPVSKAASGAAAAPPIGATLGERNVWVCIILSMLVVSFLVVFISFMPLYLVNTRHLDKVTMSWLMAMWGLPSVGYAFLVPGSSDFLGRKPVAIAMSAAAALIPLSALFIDGPVWPLFVLFGLGASISGIYPIVMATIPAETVPAPQFGTVLGLTMGLGAAVGGIFSPVLAGMLGDAQGLRAVLWILVAISAMCVMFACALRETAPVALKRRSIAVASS